MQQDCNTLCECWTDCGANSYCSCDACEALAPDAASDSQFFTIRNAAASSGAATANIIAGVNPQGGSRRRLQQTAADVTNQLADVLLRVDSLKDAQAGVTGQLNALQSQVDKANLLAEARAASTTIQDLIAGVGVCVCVCVLRGGGSAGFLHAVQCLETSNAQAGHVQLHPRLAWCFSRACGMKAAQLCSPCKHKSPSDVHAHLSLVVCPSTLLLPPCSRPC